MNLMDILDPACIIAPLNSTEKQGVINELIDRMGEVGSVSDVQSLKDAVWTREQTRTTGIGHGLAIPHGKCASLKRQSLAIGKPAEPIDFEAIDTQPVQLVVLLASPAGQDEGPYRGARAYQPPDQRFELPSGDLRRHDARRDLRARQQADGVKTRTEFSS